MKAPHRTRLAALCLLSTAAFAQSPNSTKAAEAFLAGARLASQNNLAAAQLRFAEAAALDPTRADYARTLDATRDHRVSALIQSAARARLAGNPTEADKLLDEARLVDPTNERVLEHTAAAEPPPPAGPTIPDLAFAPPIQVAAKPLVTDLHLAGDIRQDVTSAAGTFGLKVVFDESVTPLQLKFNLEQTTYAQSFPILLRTAHLFSVAVDSKTLLIAKDTQDNRARFERQAEETIYLPALTTEQLNEVTNVVKNVFDIQKAVVSPTFGTLVLRAPEPTLKAVNATLKDLIDGEAQVVLEFKLVTIDRSRSRNTGATTPTSVNAFSAYQEAESVVSANQSLLQEAISSGAFTIPTGLSAGQILLLEALFLVKSGLATDVNISSLIALAGGGLTTLGISAIGSAGFNFGLNTSEARALDDITVRVGNRQTTTLRVGEKYPITTSTYSSGLSSATTSALAGQTINGVSVSSLLAAVSTATVPIIQYEDLGITLKTTPTVLKSGLVSIHVDLKLEALTGAALDNIPILTSRVFVSDITVADGASAMMLSDLSRSEAASISGLPGLGEIPGLSQAAADTLKETDSSELVLLVTPHLARRRSNLSAGPRIAFSTSVPQDF